MYPHHDFNSRPSARGDGINTPDDITKLFQFTPLREGRRHPRDFHNRLFYFNSRPSARGDHAECHNQHGYKDFNSRPSARGDVDWTDDEVWEFLISIHAPPRGATNAEAIADDLIDFNSRPSARGDASTSSRYFASTFQFTPLREGRRKPKRGIRWQTIFQFTPLREGRPDNRRHFYREYISIHAPPRGATPVRPDFLVQREISIHAPPRGATGTCECCITTVDFNSRPSARGDGAFWYDDWFGSISIHAPPRGATTFADLLGSARRLFQFTPLREGRRTGWSWIPSRGYFNSRPSARGDQQRQPAARRNPYFNSRPSARGDATCFRECVL